MAATEVIDHDHAVAGLDQLFDGVRTDIAGPAGDHDVHAVRLRVPVHDLQRVLRAGSWPICRTGPASGSVARARPAGGTYFVSGKVNSPVPLPKGRKRYISRDYRVVCNPPGNRARKSSMRIAVTGAAGQLGRELCRLLGGGGPAAGNRHAGPDRPRGRARATARAATRGGDQLRGLHGTWTRPSTSRSGAARSMPRRSSTWPRRAGGCDCPLVQVSTDYVFGGAADRAGPYREDEPSPRRKASMPAASWKGNGRRPATRSTWWCGPAACTPGPVTPRRGTSSRRSCGWPARSRSCAWWPTNIARRATCRTWPGRCCSCWARGAARPAPWGIYHVTNGGAATWYELARRDRAPGGARHRGRAITTAEYGAAAPRPAYSVLDTAAYHRLGGPPMPDWKAALAEYFADLRTGPR